MKQRITELSGVNIVIDHKNCVFVRDFLINMKIKSISKNNKLDIGGGESREDDWITIDINPKADIVHDLNALPWPVRTEECTRIRMFHVLEHLYDPLSIMREVYRISKPLAEVEIWVPWWKNDMFANPNHKHCFKPIWFKNLSKQSGVWSGEMQCHSDIDFKIISITHKLGRVKFWKRYELIVTLMVMK